MKIAVYGLWHLGSVTAACLAEAGFRTVGVDEGPAVAELGRGRPPLFEPGLEALVGRGLAAGSLSFTEDLAAAVEGAGLVWVTFDTPVDEEDRADVGLVESRIDRLFPHLQDGTVVLISSQLPVGSTRAAAGRFAEVAGGRRAWFAYSPENLRLGKAIEVFKTSERIVIGVDAAEARAAIEPVLSRFSDTLVWMSVPSAEMVKHALNAFLATSVTFINEIAAIGEQVGADAAEVERGLKSEARIGPKAYLRPGPAFAGGTLARDVTFLTGMATAHGLSVPLLSGIVPSNQQHRFWALRRLTETLGSLHGRTVAVLGLAYKVGTDTLRRSLSVELVRRLAEAGAVVRGHDPAIARLPDELDGVLSLAATPEDAIAGADALVVATEWPEFRALDADRLLARMRAPVVIDQNRFLYPAIGREPRIRYITMGTGS